MVMVVVRLVVMVVVMGMVMTCLAQRDVAKEGV